MSNNPIRPTDGASLSRDDVAAHFAGTATPCTDRTDALARLDATLRHLTDYTIEHIRSGRWSQTAEGATLRVHLEELRACRAALED